MNLLPFTDEELQAIIPNIEAKLQAMADAEPFEVKPIGPLTVDECMEYFCRLMDAAAAGPLTGQQCFIHGQLLSQFRMAVQAEMMGKRGRYFVMSEEDLLRHAREGQSA